MKDSTPSYIHNLYVKLTYFCLLLYSYLKQNLVKVCGVEIDEVK